MEATGEIISVKAKYSKYGQYFGVTVKVAEKDFVWFKWKPKDQARQPLSEGLEVKVVGEETGSQKDFRFVGKVIVMVIGGKAKECAHRTLNSGDDGTYVCGTCDAEFVVQQLVAA